MDKKEALKIILKSANIYRDTLENKNNMFIFNDTNKKTQYFEAAFYPHNYLHLTGVDVINPTIKSRVDFYNRCLKNELDVKILCSQMTERHK